MTMTEQRCATCGQPSTLLCDGRIYTMPNGKQLRVPMNFIKGKTRTCDAPVCRQCAKKVTDVHLKTSKGCRWDSIDLCPACQTAQEKPVEVIHA